MIKELLLSFFFKIFKKVIPIISRKIYPQKEFIKDIEIRAREQYPAIVVRLYGIPTIDVYLLIKNNSPYINVFLEGGIFSLWIKDDRGLGKLLNQVCINEKLNIKKKETKQIYRAIELKQSQIDYLKNTKASKELTVNIDLIVYIRSLLYNFIKTEVSLKNISCKIQ
ncbi:hypothetical protein ES705_00643 [subsurface metagenome]|nr:hypothetical protein [Clostridia bacterium]